MIQEFKALEASAHARLHRASLAAHATVAVALRTTHGIKARTLLALSKAVAVCATPLVRLSGWLAKKSA